VTTRRFADSGLLAMAVIAAGAVPYHGLPASGPSQGIPSVVEGSTVDSTGAPIPEVEVTVIALGLSVRTSQQGTFRLSIPSAGTYAVRFRRIGYRAQVIEVVATRPVVALRPIVLRAVPEQLVELAVEGRLPPPTFYLRASFPVSGKIQSGPRYQTWETRGAALSPNALLAIRHLAPGGAFLRLHGWYDSPNKSTSWYMIGVGGCPDKFDLPLAAAWHGLSDTLLLLDRSGAVWGKRVHHLDTQGTCHRKTIIGVGRAIMNGGPMLGGWLVAGFDSAGTAHLTLYSATGEAIWDTKPPPFLDSRQALKGAHIAGTTVGATIASDTWPFDWAELNASGGLRIRARPFRTLTDSIQYARWTALPVLPITNGFVQTLTNPGAGQRRIVLYDLLGKPISVSQSAGAPGFVASDLSRRKLIGLRYSSAGRGRSEIVEYDY
jgi:hypothetical protein